MHPAGHNEQSSRPFRRLMVGAVLGAAYLVVRLPGLMALPIFGDEAIYLRWAQLVRGGHPWVSLIDPKPPLHFWLLAAVIQLGSDPLLPARLLSIFAGLLSVWLMLGVGAELGRLAPGREGAATKGNGWAMGLLGAVLMIFCPFLAFYQRFATADALFAAESLAIVWLSLLWGRLAARGERRAWWAALGLGVTIGAGLMTRQGVSYTLCAMPAAGFVLHAWSRLRRRILAGGLLQLVLAAIVAGAIWSPYLLVQPASGPGSVPADAPSGALLKEIKGRVFYQEHFTQGGPGRSQIAGRNAGLMFVPKWDNGVPVSGWFFVYLTPVVYALCLAGLVAAALRSPRMFLFLLVWLLLVIGPLVFLANVIYSRYVLAGVLPMLFGAAFLLVQLVQWMMVHVREGSAWAWAGPLALLAAVIAWPIKDIALQGTHWSIQTLTDEDDRQYIRGWTGGFAAMDTVRTLQTLAKVGPLVVITDDGWGTPSDAVWAYLVRNPNVHLFYANDLRTIVPQGPNGRVTLKDQKWLYPAPASVNLADFGDGPVLVVTKANRDDGQDAMAELPRENPNLHPWQTFKGKERTGKPAGEGVAVFSIKWQAPKAP